MGNLDVLKTVVTKNIPARYIFLRLKLTKKNSLQRLSSVFTSPVSPPLTCVPFADHHVGQSKAFGGGSKINENFFLSMGYRKDLFSKSGTKQIF